MMKETLHVQRASFSNSRERERERKRERERGGDACDSRGVSCDFCSLSVKSTNC